MSRSSNLIPIFFALTLVLPGGLGAIAGVATAATGPDVLMIAVYKDFGSIPSDSWFDQYSLEVIYRYAAIPGVLLRGPEGMIEELRLDGRIDFVEEDAPVQYFLETATFASKAADVWGSSWWPVASDVQREDPSPLTVGGVPIDGRGITVGVVDSGIDASHPDLWYAPAASGTPFTPKVKACINVISTLTTVDSPDCDQSSGHGTHVAGIVAGNGWAAKAGLGAPFQTATRPPLGAAPASQLVAAGLGVGINVPYSTVALDWMYRNAAQYDIRIVTNSWGTATSSCASSIPAPDATNQIVNKLVNEKGITVLFAASNYGIFGDLTSTQAHNPTPGVIVVANYDDLGGKSRDAEINDGSSDGCATASGTGSGTNLWTWPDVAAPGTSITSTIAKTGAVTTPFGAYYGLATGTSMATPHVAGIVALMLQANPDLTPAQIERILIETATPWSDTVAADSGQGWTGTSKAWGTANKHNTGFVNPDQCLVTPLDAAKAESGDTSVNAKFPHFTTLATKTDADLYVCRDFKRGRGLVDAYAAVERAIALRDDDPPGTPSVSITTPTHNAGVPAGLVPVEGLVDRLGSPNAAPTAQLSASPLSGPSPLEVDFALTGSDADGTIASWTLSFGDGTADATGTGPINAFLVEHTYTALGSYTATLTVTDDDGATGVATLAISVTGGSGGGLPVADGTISGQTLAYNAAPANAGISNIVAWVTGAAGDDVPKYVPGDTMGVYIRGAKSNNANVPIDTATPAALFIFRPDGTQVAGPVTMSGSADGANVQYGTPFLIPADWNGRYLLAVRLTVDGTHYWATSTQVKPSSGSLTATDIPGGHKPIDVVVLSSAGPSDTGHTIADPDNDGLTPMGEIHWVDTAINATHLTVAIKLGQVPPQPAGDSPFVYDVWVNGLNIETYMFGGVGLFDNTHSTGVTDGSATWDTTNNLVTMRIPRAYLQLHDVDCPCTGRVAAMLGEGLAGGQQAVDWAPNAGDVAFRAAWQPAGVKGLDVGMQFGSESDPEATDPAGDAGNLNGAITILGNPLPPNGTAPPVSLPWMDIRKVWVSRENATHFDITVKVEDMAGLPPGAAVAIPLTTGRAVAATNYGAEFCVDNAANTYTPTTGNYAGVSSVTCYRLSASDSVSGPAFSGGVIQRDGSGSCGYSDLVESGASAFNLAASTVTWSVKKASLNVTTISGAVTDCNTAAAPTRGATPPTTGNTVSRLMGTTGHTAGALVTLTTSLLGDSSNPATARPYVLGGGAPLVADAGADVSGLAGAPIAITGTAAGGTPPYTYAWSGIGATFGDAASASTTVTFTTPGTHTIAFQVTDQGGRVATDTTEVTVTSTSTERVEIVVGGDILGSAPVSTSAQAPTDPWATTVDLTGRTGVVTLTANWREADGTLIASAQRQVVIQSSEDVFVEITEPADDPAGAAPLSGTVPVRGLAGHVQGGQQAGLNALGFPITSGSRAGLRTSVQEGIILVPCAACEPTNLPGSVPNQVKNLVEGQVSNRLSSSSAWVMGPGSVADGVDGFWFDVAGFGGGTYVLEEDIDLPVDIRFFRNDTDAQALQMSPNNGLAMPKTGTVPQGANWAFTYMRRPSQQSPDNVIALTTLTLTPLIVPPSAPQGLTATPAPEAIVLNWMPPANTGGETPSYRVERDGVAILTTSLLSYTDAPRTPGVTHTYTVTAFNSAGDGGSATASAAADPPTPVGLRILDPADGATGVPADTPIAGEYRPAGSGGSGGGAGGNFANTHYLFLLNLNDAACGNFLGFGDHVIIEKLVANAVDRMGVPAGNIHVFNEDDGALRASDDTANHARLPVSWQTGAVFDGPARIAPFTAAFQQAAMAAAAGEAAGGGPARLFVLHSSHGLQNPAGVSEFNPGGDGLFDSSMCLDDAEGWSASDFGAMVTAALDAAEAAHPGVDIEVSINIDCSFCGGFADSPFQAPQTTAAVSAGVVGENRVVEVGCSWVTECFGNPAITYDYMFNRCTFTGLADGYGPSIALGSGTGTDGGDLGNEVLLPDPAHHAADGAITLEEAYWCGLDQSVQDPDPLGDNGPWAPQQQFQISDLLPADMFGLDGFVLYEYNAALGLRNRDPTVALPTGLPLVRLSTADPEGDFPVPFADLIGLAGATTATHVVVDIDVADLSLSRAEVEDIVEYRVEINGDLYGVCYSLGEMFVYGYDIPNADSVTGSGDRSTGTATYDFDAGRVHIEIPLEELNDATVPATIFSTSHMGDCTNGSPVPGDRVPDAGTITTGSGGITPTSEEIQVTLTGPGGAVQTGLATLEPEQTTWKWERTSALAPGTWGVSVVHRFDDGSGMRIVEGPVTSSFTVEDTTDVTPPSAPGELRVTGTTSSSVSLAWGAATDDTGVAAYRVWRDGVVVATTSALSHVDSPLSSSTTYDYHVTAVDLANNEGPASNSVGATTGGVTPGMGTVTLSVGTHVVGVVQVDTSVVDPQAWTVPFDTTLVDDGAHTLSATYDDGEGNVVSTSIRIAVDNGADIAITSPAQGATVEPDFTVAGTVEGLGGPAAPMSSGWVGPDRVVDRTAPSWQVAQSQALRQAHEAYQLASGYLTVGPALDGTATIEVFFTGAAPAPRSVTLPEGWTLRIVPHVTLTRAVQKYAGFIEESRAPSPGQAVGIGPGSHLLMTMLDEPGSTFGCTANFVWKDASNNVYLGAAGHCFMPEDKTATHGPGADYDGRRTSVRVCVSGCTNGGTTGFVITGTTVALGEVVYARQENTAGTGLGHDFGIVKIPLSLYPQVRTSMPVWGGPTGSGTLGLGQPAVLYGNAAGFGEVYPTMARGGFGGAFTNANYWTAVLPSMQGDSGSALLSGIASADTDVLVGDKAIGTLTHLSPVGPVVGTTMTRSQAMAAEAGIVGLTPILAGQSLPTPGPFPPGAPTLAQPGVGQGSVTLSWTPPGSDGGAAITGYTVKYGTTAGSHTTSVDVGLATGTAITGLTNGQRYYFVVVARNSVGVGANSNEVNAVPQAQTTVPGAPTGLVAAAGNARVTLGWTAPDNGGSPITGYTVRYGTSPGTYDSSLLVTTTSATVTGLTNGATYWFSVVAHNANGAGPGSSEVSATPQQGTTPTYAVEARVVNGGQSTPWTTSPDFDGSAWTVPVTNAPLGAGTIEARLLRDGAPISVATRDVTVQPRPNEPPTARVNGPTAAVEGTPVTLDGSASTDPEGGALTFAWTQTGGPAVQLSAAATARPSFTAPQVDDHMTVTFRLRVTDPQGAYDEADIAVRIEDQAFVSVDTANGEAAVDGMQVQRVVALQGRAHLPLSSPGPNTPPTAALCGEPVVSGRTVSADGSCSTDTDGTIIIYGWNMGDGNATSGPSISYTYERDGSYTLILSVQDDRGAVDQVAYGPFQVVLPEPNGLVADAGDSGFAKIGDPVTLSAQAFGAVGGASFAWDTDNDGVPDTPGQALSVATTGMSPGVHVFTVHVVDGAGQSDTDSVLVRVYDVVTTTQTFTNAVLAGIPDEVPGQLAGSGTSGAVDGQTYHHQVVVPAGAQRIAATLDWQKAQTIATVPDVTGFFGGGDLIGVSANDFDLYAVAPDPAQNKQSAGWTKPESLAVNSPGTGTWDFRIEAYLVHDDTYTLSVQTTAGAPDPRPIASQVSDVCFETSTPTLVASVSPGATGAWDLDNDGLFETSGTTATATFAPGPHLVRFRATSVDGFRSTILVAVRIADACELVPPVVVVAVSDSGLNLYSQEFAGELTPYPELRDHTTADPGQLGPGDVVVRHKLTNAILPFTKHPSSYIPGFPSDMPALELTLGGGYYKTQDNARIWNNGHSATNGVPLNKWFWVPGTKVIGVIDTSDTAAVNSAPDTTPILDEDGHGTASAAVAVGNTVGSCQRCLLVFAEGLSGDSRFFDQPWIDFVSVSGGAPANVGIVDAGLLDIEEATRLAALRGQTISYAAGNGNENGFITPEQTYTSNSLGPDWTINVGAVTRSTQGGIVGTGKPVHWSSFGYGTIPAACPSSYGASCNHSGTSAATPISTGHLADTLLAARIAMGDELAGQKTPAQAGGKLQAIAVGKPVAASPWLSDGVLQRHELWNVAFHCASPLTTSIGGTGIPLFGSPLYLGRSAVDHAYVGYGIADDAAKACATNAILTGGAVPVRQAADEFFAIDHDIRVALWGDWDGNADGEPGGNFNGPDDGGLPLSVSARSVANVDGATRLLRQLSASPVAVTTTHYLHRDACATAPYMDVSTKAAKEGGHGCVDVTKTSVDTRWTSTVPLATGYASGSTVTAVLRAFTQWPQTNVAMDVQLLVGGTVVGAGETQQLTSLTLRNVATPCSEWVASFVTSVDVPAGSTLTLQATTSGTTGDFGFCYDGGTAASRVAITGVEPGGGTGGTTPITTITSPAQGASVGPGGSVAITGTATFPATASTQRLWLGRADCGTASDGLQLSPDGALSDGNGCAFTRGAAAPAGIETLIETYPLLPHALPLTLSDGAPIQGAVSFGTQGVDPARIRFTANSSQGVIGSVTKEFTNVAALGVPGAYTVEFSIPVPSAFAGVALDDFRLEIQILQQGAAHWTELEDPESWIDVPRLASAPGKQVQVAIDDPTFATGLLTVTGLESWTANWDLAQVEAGEHVIYARALTSQGPGALVSRTVTVVRDEPATTGPAHVEIQWVPEGQLPAGAGWIEIPLTPQGEWAYAWNTTSLPNGRWTFHARVLDTDGNERHHATWTPMLANEHAPVLATIGDKTLHENSTLAFTVSATDEQGDAITYGSSPLPAGASLDPQTGAFHWVPTYNQAGNYTVTFTATAVGGTDEETIVIHVLDLQTSPVFERIGQQTVPEGGFLTFTVRATDADGDEPTYGAEDLPPGAAFDPQTRTFTYDAPYFAGHAPTDLVVRFTATDGNTTDVMDVPIRVTDVNRRPVITGSDHTGAEGQLISFFVTGSDPDGDGLSYSASPLPRNASINPTTGEFRWTPDYEQMGVYLIEFRATDGSLSATTNLSVTVLNTDRAPVFVPIPEQSVRELSAISIPVRAIDPDGDSVTYTAVVPTGATFATNNQMGWINWTTKAGDHGVYPITVRATSQQGLVDEESFNLTVLFLGGLQLERVENRTVHTSPQTTVTIRNKVTNTGPNRDTFALQVIGDSRYAVTFPSPTVTLEPGESSIVTYDVRTPANWYFADLQLRVTSQGDATASRFLMNGVETSVIATVVMNDTKPGLTNETISGVVIARHLDGTPYAGAPVTLRVTATVAGQRALFTGSELVTGADGKAYFSRSDPNDKLPGRHTVTATLPRPGASNVVSNEATYDVLI